MGKTAFLCSGQGAQRLGMGLDFARECAESAHVYELATQAAGFDVLALCGQGPLEELSSTQNTQPALVATSLAIAAALRQRGVEPDCVAGFSLGEYAAHALAGTLTQRVALDLVSKRGLFMADAAARVDGGMAALLRCDEAGARALCEKHAHACGQVLVPANMNCPGQVVISGQSEALAAACADWKAQGGKVSPLKTSGAFHSPLMEPAAQRMRLALQMTGFSAARIDLYCNCTGRVLEVGQEAATLERQITAPVLWERTVRSMVADGVTRFIECGPGKVLTGMVKRTVRAMGADVRYMCVQTVQDMEAFDG